MKKGKKLWGNAFKHKPKEEAISFTAGRDVKSLPPADEILIPYEILASKAYAKALYDKKIITSEDKEKLISSLDEINNSYEQGKLHIKSSDEDVHTLVESMLTEELEIDIAGKIHSGRSRSDQIAVDMILYMKDKNEIFIKNVSQLISTLELVSKNYSDIIVPGYTHHQHATVTTFENIIDSYTVAFKKDLQRFLSWNEFEEISPLGAAASYGSTFPVDKHKINEYLGLKKVFENEISALTFRGDAETQLVFNLSMLMNHISGLAQTLILFSTKEFGFVNIHDYYSTGSSIMPQKKNADTLEVIKAKASMCQGYLMSLLGITKSLFIGYNRDLQWTKYVVMDAIREVEDVPKIMGEIIKTLKVNVDVMKLQTSKGFILAQAIMEGLAQEFKIPMRLAKLIVEEVVKNSDEKVGFEIPKINAVLDKFQIKKQVSEKQFKEWTDPLSVAKRQMKRVN